MSKIRPIGWMVNWKIKLLNTVTKIKFTGFKAIFGDGIGNFIDGFIILITNSRIFIRHEW
jgi:hypothetical protein